MSKKLFDTDKKAYVDSVLHSNMNIEWVKRLYDKNPKSIYLSGELYPSTHMMSDNDNGYAFPRIQMINGKLTDLGDRAEYYARETNTGIQLPKKKEHSMVYGGMKLKKHYYIINLKNKTEQ